MKNDFRLRYPLWNMAFILVLGVMAIGLNSRFVDVTKTENSLTINAQAFDGAIVFGSLLLYLVLITIYLSQLKAYNAKNPDSKISPFAIRPPEYMEEDEGMTFITRKAVQKVYTFFTWALPTLALILLFFPLPRLYIIWGILAVSFGQYFIYYLEIRKHFKEETE
ncbi:hypothetical protein [Planococcus salinus]|uniref:DUF3169 family protein n=1 Tax=Planococcus salinus TaxID=1848460 RepID=A0A3M8PCK7_9BACL|nr:hypothetical protein [Planococcus salinus]RNF40880.1 hypothetical protein EEX84_00555 [Planococcus salinus]